MTQFRVSQEQLTENQTSFDSQGGKVLGKEADGMLLIDIPNQVFSPPPATTTEGAPEGKDLVRGAKNLAVQTATSLGEGALQMLNLVPNFVTPTPTGVAQKAAKVVLGQEELLDPTPESQLVDKGLTATDEIFEEQLKGRTPEQRQTIQGIRTAGNFVGAAPFFFGAGRSVKTATELAELRLLAPWKRFIVTANQRKLTFLGSQGLIGYVAGGNAEEAAQEAEHLNIRLREEGRAGELVDPEFERFTSLLTNIFGLSIGMATAATTVKTLQNVFELGLSNSALEVKVGQTLAPILESAEVQTFQSNTLALKEAGMLPQQIGLPAATGNSTVKALAAFVTGNSPLEGELRVATEAYILRTAEALRPVKDMKSVEQILVRTANEKELMIIGNQNRINAIFSQEIEEAFARANILDPAQRGQIMQSMFKTLKSDSKKHLKVLSDAVPDFTIPNTHYSTLMERVGEAININNVKDPNNIVLPQSVRDMHKLFNVNFGTTTKKVPQKQTGIDFANLKPILSSGVELVPAKITFQGLRTINATLGGKIKAAELSGDTAEIGRLNVFKRALDDLADDLERDASIPIESAVALQQSNGARRTFALQFQAGKVKLALNKNDQGLLKTAPEDFFNTFIIPNRGLKSIQSAENLMALIKDKPEALLALEEHIGSMIYNLSRDAVTKEVTPTTLKMAQNYLVSHSNAIKTFKLEKKFGNIQQGLRNAELIAKDIPVKRSQLERSALVTFLAKPLPKKGQTATTKLGTMQKLSNKIDTMIQTGIGKTEPFAYEDLKALTKEINTTSDHNLINGYRTLVWERLFARTRNLQRTAGEVETKVGQFKESDLPNMLFQHEDTLRFVLGNSHYEKLRSITSAVGRALAFETRAGALPEAATQLITESTQRFLKSPVSRVFQEGRAALRGFVAPDFVVASITRQVGAARTQKRVVEILERAVTDERYADDLLKIAQTEAGAKLITSFWLGGPALFQGSFAEPEYFGHTVKAGAKTTLNVLQGIGDAIIDPVKRGLESLGKEPAPTARPALTQ